MINNRGLYQPSLTALARATHSLTRLLITLLVALVVLLPAFLSTPVSAATTAAEVTDAADAMAPLDTSSPRATLRSFLTLSEAVARRYQDYRDAPSRETQAALYMRVRRAAELLDLSRVPPATRAEVASETFVLLWEILARVELPAFDSIPGDQEAGTIKRWRIPHTAITIARVSDGNRAGEFLFSADTVADARTHFLLGKELPHLRPLPGNSAYIASQRLTGWMIALAWVDALPEWANTLVLGQLAWKWLALLLLLAALFTVITVIYRWARQGRWDGSLASCLRRLNAPLLLLGLAYLLGMFATQQINVSGPGGRGFIELIDLLKGVGAVWAVWVTMTWIAEAFIASPTIHSKGLTAHMIRLVARAAGTVTILVLVFRVGNDLGIPLYGLVAGAGVGGLGIALAAKSTLENFMGTLNLFADRPVKVGDFCRFGADPSPGYLRIGTIEEIGLRSTRIRGIDRTLTTIPNAEFSNLQIVNLSQRDQMLLMMRIGLRHGTTPDQLRLVLTELRKMLLAHPRITPDPARARLTGFGEWSIDVEIFAYVATADWNEFLAIQEDILLRIMDIVTHAGTAIAFPSRTIFHARDTGLDRERQQSSEQQVREWTAAQNLPFPDFPDDYRAQIMDTLDYPPKGSHGAGGA
ncbi:mechanosensitive ion channel family protein [Candidatus Accumulibacter sp. ACC003]|uniref:mechanosensitive ion channel family protein n=1 Tax=Candidatus Accumulibacter sp. ACC003 TaxID=2823334 RepID=UPI0025BA867C|nr:mechanosensitive ion channel family protein [Candidatus Accumulibacter sp. ACC003]